MTPILLKIIAIITLFCTKQNDKPPANHRNFISCPIIRDSKTFPCWLVEYEGELYYLGQQGRTGSLFYPPQLKHEVLVEGTIKEGQRICGGIVLDPVVISVMPEINANCNTILPPQEGLEPPPPIPYPKNDPFPDSTRAFTILFDFDNDFLSVHKTRIVGEAVRIAKLCQAKKIEIKGFRGTVWLSNGQKMIEKEAIAQLRAEKIGEMFTGLGFKKEMIKVDFKTKPESYDGVHDAEKRRVTIELK
jgi:outer membrane protein OmpA-like peptidoglycan-associated protein